MVVAPVTSWFRETAKLCVFRLKNDYRRLRRVTRTVTSLSHFELKLGYARVRKNIEYCSVATNGYITGYVMVSRNRETLCFSPQKWLRRLRRVTRTVTSLFHFALKLGYTGLHVSL